MNRIQGKDHRIETYEINKISLTCFDDQTMDMREQLLGTRVNHKKHLLKNKSEELMQIA